MTSTSEEFLFTSESVNEGHPDKMCDIISDAILDACLTLDPNAKVACETATKTGLVMVFGEITCRGYVDYQHVIRDTIKEIGFDSDSKGFDYKTCSIIIALEEQSADIAQGVHVNRTSDELGAGDQGHMFGYATDETPELMPFSHLMATKLGMRLTEVRKSGLLPWVRPDGKTQVTVSYSREPDGSMRPLRVHTIVISTQHDDSVSNEEIRRELMEKVIRVVVPAEFLDDQTIYHLNPSGRFVIGGPQGDAGLTGRKIIVDTYGGWGAHGGGAFSGKDYSKVDRSAAYAARWIAKSLVAAKLCRRALVQISYAIGIAQPLSVYVDAFGSCQEGYTNAKLLEVVHKNFDLRPGVIVGALNLDKPKYRKTACYGHFGREDPMFTWEVPKPLVL